MTSQTQRGVELPRPGREATPAVHQAGQQNRAGAGAQPAGQHRGQEDLGQGDQAGVGCRVYVNEHVGV